MYVLLTMGLRKIRDVEDARMQFQELAQWARAHGVVGRSLGSNSKMTSRRSIRLLRR